MNKETEIQVDGITITQVDRVFFGVGVHAVVDLRQIGEKPPAYICRGCGNSDPVLAQLVKQTACRVAA